MPSPTSLSGQLPSVSPKPSLRWVRVWFGTHVIADYKAEPREAEAYVFAMERRFFGLRVTNDPLDDPAADIQALPARHWWQVPPP